MIIIFTVHLILCEYNIKKQVCIFSSVSTGELNIYFFFFFVFLGLHLQRMEVPRAGVESELQLLAYATATATPDPKCLCDLHHGSRQCRILNLLIKVRDQTCILIYTSPVHYH